MESMFRSVAGSMMFAKIDMCHKYWQIPLHQDSQDFMSIETPLGTFTPTRILQGSTDAGNHFQSVSALAFSELQKNMLQRVDDLYFMRTQRRFFSPLYVRSLRSAERVGLRYMLRRSIFTVVRRPSLDLKSTRTKCLTTLINCKTFSVF